MKVLVTVYVTRLCLSHDYWHYILIITSVTGQRRPDLFDTTNWKLADDPVQNATVKRTKPSRLDRAQVTQQVLD